jgi:hypothetical protein
MRSGAGARSGAEASIQHVLAAEKAAARTPWITELEKRQRICVYSETLADVASGASSGPSRWLLSQSLVVGLANAKYIETDHTIRGGPSATAEEIDIKLLVPAGGREGGGYAVEKAG